MQYKVIHSEQIDMRNENDALTVNESSRCINTSPPRAGTIEGKKDMTKFEPNPSGNVVIVEPSFDEAEDPANDKQYSERQESSPLKKPQHKRDLSAQFHDATRISDAPELMKRDEKRENPYPIQHARPSRAAPRASPSRVPDAGPETVLQNSSHPPPSPAINVGSKHRRGYSGGMSHSSVAHRRINSIGDTAFIDRFYGANQGYYPPHAPPPPPPGRRAHRREDSAGLDILSAVADVSKDPAGQKHESRKKKGAWDAPPESNQSEEHRMDPPQPVSVIPSYDYNSPYMPPPTAYPPPYGYSTSGGHPPAPPQFSSYNPHDSFYPPGRYQPPPPPPPGYQRAPYPPQYAPGREGDSNSRPSPHPVYEVKSQQLRATPDDKMLQSKDNRHEWRAGTTTGVQTFVTAISVGDGNKTVIPAPAQRSSSGGRERGPEHPPIPASIGHHRKLSSYSSLGPLSTIFSDADQQPRNAHHRSTSSSISFLQGLEADGDMFLQNLHSSNAPAVGMYNPTNRPYTSPPPTEGTQQVNVVAGSDASSHTLASGGTSKRIRRKCTMEGCTNRVVQGGLCISHGAKRKTCKHPGCNKNVKKAGLCSTHGPARKRCEQGGCSKVAVQGGRCIAHGAKKKLCHTDGCSKQAILSGMCKKHHDECGGAGEGKPATEGCVVINNSKSNKPKKPSHARGLSIFQEMSADSVQTLLMESDNTDCHPLKSN
mmetsp:Transcript_4082/g.5869  ORF Transcript_4082/g.5869 Transcript_4082/m.5869 type:complete len:710 (+) Transcript_4082:160-2289(+)|eukprot:CAMPEP_0194214220 /NCGR_PEP_ID=MMETSP0156-20130528/15360_1 /TAXON_ID=33649 /ORGANISM="Thalassionema nitzschioides, Strain L26-B" /LENGTH=709 /DNA_ID=CAMNT_0038942443 /DNA_START=132 /DNA_END=2261 /DNA_ORIENTATION=+